MRNLSQDSCSAECGREFEGFWDECGEMLKNANMGGMEEMDQFYTHCLEARDMSSSVYLG